MDKLNKRQKKKVHFKHHPPQISQISHCPKISFLLILLSPRPSRSRCFTVETSSPTAFFTSSTVMARVKIPATQHNPSLSKHRRLGLQESSTGPSESNVPPMAVETPRERDVFFFYFNLRHIHITICIFYRSPYLLKSLLSCFNLSSCH